MKTVRPISTITFLCCATLLTSSLNCFAQGGSQQPSASSKRYLFAFEQVNLGLAYGFQSDWGDVTRLCYGHSTSRETAYFTEIFGAEPIEREDKGLSYFENKFASYMSHRYPNIGSTKCLEFRTADKAKAWREDMVASSTRASQKIVTVSFPFDDF